jgi:hypothetical protein
LQKQLCDRDATHCSTVLASSLLEREARSDGAVLAGGELFHHLDLEGAFSEATAKFYAACVVAALAGLHARGIVYRDLKPGVDRIILDGCYLAISAVPIMTRSGVERSPGRD